MEQTIAFPKIFNTTTGKVNLASGTESINDCLYILLNSMSPELRGDPMYGSNILELSFEYEGPLLEELLRSKILDAIEKYERRILVTAEDITFKYNEETITIELKYFVKAEGVYKQFSLAMLNSSNT